MYSSTTLKTRRLYAAMCLIVIGLSIPVNASTAQSSTSQHTVTGTVTDAATGQTLPGVNVVIQGTTRGTATDNEGQYSLEVPGPESVLVFSFIGYETQRITVGGQEVIDVSLETDLGRLDEVIVVGYGTVQRSDLTGSVERVRTETFQDQATTQLTEMLAGTVTGLYATQGTSAQGGTNMEIRGRNSINAGTDPLIVLDGVIYNGDLEDINPNDIETIDVLKDASSTAIYGARAASGVVLVTTKKGQLGTKPTVNFTSRVSRVDALNKDFATRNPEEYIAFRQNHFLSDWERRSEPDFYWAHPDNLPEGVTLEQWRNAANNPHDDNLREWTARMNFFPLEQENYLAGRVVDWPAEVLRGGLQWEGDLGISGGTEDVRYYWSVGYQSNEGIVIGDEFGAVRTRLNVDFNPVDWLSVGANTQFSRRDESSTPASVGELQQTSPFSRIYLDDGTMTLHPHGYIAPDNPLIFYTMRDRDRKLSNLFASLYAEVALPYGISHRVSFQPRIESLRDYEFDRPYLNNLSGTFTRDEASRVDFHRYEWMLDNLLKWNREFGVHRFDLTLLYSAEQDRSWLTETENHTFLPSPVLGYSGIHFGSSPVLESFDTEATGDAMLARLNYVLMDRYLFTGSIRRDGYSAFGQENPHATFPAGALAWIISEEDFFNVDFINNLKLRLSWGKNGNREIGQYAALSQLESTQYYDGSSIQQGIFTETLANQGLRWEETESFNVGLDVSLLDGRANINLDYYDATTKNLLVARTLPDITGFSEVTTNIGELGNKGLEMTLRTSNIISPTFSWRSNVVMSANRNKIKALFGDTGTYTLLGEQREGEIPDFANEWFVGRALDAVWNYDIEGIWQLGEEAEAAKYGLYPGDFKVHDVNGDGIYQEVEDKKFIGYTEPRLRLGFRNEFDFLRNFSASVFLRADLGHIREFTRSTDGPSTYDRRGTTDFPYWSITNPTNDYPRLGRYESSMGRFGGGIGLFKPASFLRVQDVTLSYTLPLEFIQRAQVQNLRIFGSVRNLATFTRWPDYDPESVYVPMPRTITFGLNVAM